MDGTLYPVGLSVDYPDRELLPVDQLFPYFHDYPPIAIVLGVVVARPGDGGATATGPPGRSRARVACDSSARCS